MKLYWFWSFNPQKARLALLELGLPHELVEVDLAKGEQRTEEFKALNPSCKVPVLVDDDFVLWESNAILAYLGERERRLWPQEAQKRGAALQWMFFEARHLSPFIGALWFNDFVAVQAGRAADRQARRNARKSLPAPLRVLDGHLATRNWMLGDEFTLVDCCYGPLLDALTLSNFELADYIAVRAYVDRIRARPPWQACGFRARAG